MDLLTFYDLHQTFFIDFVNFSISTLTLFAMVFIASQKYLLEYSLSFSYISFNDRPQIYYCCDLLLIFCL